jgi:hypothetical protein
MYYLLFAVILIAQAAYCRVALGADELDLIVICFLTVAAGGGLAYDLSREETKDESVDQQADR